MKCYRGAECVTRGEVSLWVNRVVPHVRRACRSNFVHRGNASENACAMNETPISRGFGSKLHEQSPTGREAILFSAPPPLAQVALPRRYSQTTCETLQDFNRGRKKVLLDSRLGCLRDGGRRAPIESNDPAVLLT
jgi:hypothetical protein